MDMCTLLHLKWITNKILLYSTGPSAQADAAAWMGVLKWRWGQSRPLGVPRHPSSFASRGETLRDRIMQVLVRSRVVNTNKIG